MKRFTMLRLGAVLVLAAMAASCGNANQFDYVLSVSRLCIDQTCSNLYDESEGSVSVTGDQFLTLYFELTNWMTAEDDATQVIHCYRAEIRYVPPAGPDIPYKDTPLTADVLPGDSLIQPITVLNNTQIEYIRDRLDQYPDVPFQLNCKITIFYTTTGGISGSVEEQFPVTITE